MQVTTIASLTKKAIVFLLLLVASVSISGTAFSQTPGLKKSKPADRKETKKPTGIDFCLISEEYVDGLTHPNGFRLGEGGTGDLDYPLLKPVFTLTAKHVKSCELKASVNPFNKKHLQYDVCVELNDLGRAEMYAAFKGVNDAYTRNTGLKGSGRPLKGASYLWVVNGKPFEVTRYFRPEWTTPKAIGEYGRPNGKLSIGAFSDRNLAFGQSFIDALKPNAVQDPTKKPTPPDAKKPTPSDAEKPIASDAEKPIASGPQFKFLVLEGVDREAGRFNKPTVTTVNRMVPQQRTKTVNVERNGVKETITQTYTIMVPVAHTVRMSFDAKTHNVYDGNGELIPSNKAFDRLKDGQLVIISSTSKLPKEYLKLLSPEASIIAPKPKTRPEK